MTLQAWDQLYSIYSVKGRHTKLYTREKITAKTQMPLPPKRTREMIQFYNANDTEKAM